MKTQEQLINNIIGQLNGINKMIEEEKDCFMVMTQIKAAKSALNSFTNKFIEENFLNCFTNECQKNKKKNEDNLKKLFIELTKSN